MWAKRYVVLVAAVGLSLVALFLFRAPRRPVPSPSAGALHDAGGGGGPASLSGVSVDCRELVPPQRVCAPLDDDPLAPVIRAANDLTISAVPCSTSSDRSGKWQKVVLLAFERLADVDPASLPVSERIIAQNAALRIGLCAPKSPELPGAEIIRAAAVQVARFALPAADLTKLGTDATPEVHALLGNGLRWEERRPMSDEAFHERAFALTKLVHLVRVGQRLVSLGQLVALDTAWKPHLTPIVGSLEMRDVDPNHPNPCAASLDLAWLRCGLPLGLRPLLPARPLEEDASILFATDRAGIPCSACHHGPPHSSELFPDAGPTASDERRERMLAKLSIAVAELRAGVRR